MSNKMLIDASHPEETRVAVVRGNRIEEFDFESQEKKQLRGNIYLAKVTRVEPSLQAAFVDYGGNRHGFLAFSEIHPDYYQIPMADRQALLEAEAAEERARRDEEEQDAAEDNAAEDASTSEASEEKAEQPKKKPARKRRSRKAKAAEEVEAAEGEDASGEKPADQSETADETGAVEETAAAEEAAEPVAQDEPEAEKPAPKRRTTRRKTATKKTAKAAKEKAPAEEEGADAGHGDDGEPDDDDNPTTMAAIVEVDSISEDLPETGSGDEEDGTSEVDASSEDESEPAGTKEANAEAEPVAEEKPKRRTSRRRTSRKKETEASKEEEASSEAGDEAPVQAEAETEATSSNNDASNEGEENSEEQEKPKKRSSRRRSSRSKKKAEEADAKDASADPDGNGDDEANGNNGNDVEQVGQEDALEEVPSPRRQRRYYKIQEVIKRRQILLVQVVKEERGNKGAALTTYLSLAGRYSVLMPNTARGGGISRKITNAADRKRLKSIASKLDVPEGMGVILRTAGASRTDAEIKRDFEYLMRLWEQVRNLTLSSSAPCLVYEEGSLIKRSIRDLYDKDTGDILVTGEQGYHEAKDFMSMLMPEHSNKVKQYTNKQALFAKFGVEAQLDRMMTPQVTLKSGGYLVINQTEALVAVDVNSGRSTREHSIEDTALQTNLEAAEEVARQLRLRDLAGLIVIDFIDMEEKRNNRAVEKRLKECLKNDRARIQVGRISHFGLLEMSRQRMRSSVLESTMDVCEHCGGLGYIRSDSAIALHVFRAIEDHVSRHNKFDAVVKTTRAIAFHILNHKRASLLELEKLYGLRVIIQGEANIQGQEFNIEKGDPAQGDVASAAVGFQNEAALEALSADGEEEKEQPSGKRRGRRRNAKNNDVQEEADGETNAPTSEDEADEDAPRRKRRRGKRGGRKRGKSQEGEETPSSDAEPAAENDGDATSEEAQAEPSPAEAAPEPVAEAEPAAEPVTAVEEDADKTSEPEGEEKKPARRNRVTQKAPIQEKPAAEAVAQETAEEPRPEPPRPQRRRTSRRTESVSEEAASSAPVEEVVASSAQGEPAVAEPAPEKKEGKKGWWSRGGGFF